MSHTRLQAAAYCHGGTIDGLAAVGNAIGVSIAEHGEYVTLTNSHMMQNTTGLVVRAGSTKVTQCNIASNIDGVVINDNVGGTHGMITNCLINHNQRYALDCNNVGYGVIVNACGINHAAIRLRGSAGVRITQCHVSCSVSIEGDALNLFAHNYVVEHKYNFKFSDSTLIHNNYTPNGAWRFNQAVDSMHVKSGDI
jgi:hypothetical protein